MAVRLRHGAVPCRIEGRFGRPVRSRHHRRCFQDPPVLIFYNLVTQIAQAFQEFNGPYIIFNNGGPRGSVTLVSLLVYNYAFKSNEMGMACAMAWVMFIIIALLTVIAFGSQKHWVYYAD